LITARSVSRLPSVKFDGLYRVLGLLPSDPNCGLPAFYQAHPVLPESEWREIDMESFTAEVKNQGMSSACVGHGCSSGLEMAILQAGRPKQALSAFFLYSLINHGRDAGSSISDALLALKSTGTCPEDMAPQGAMFAGQFPDTCKRAAARFRLFEAYQCGTFEEICSAITLGFPTPLGLYVGQNFSSVDSEGICPPPNGGGGGHCVLGMGLKKTSRGWAVKIQNSWGTRFGQGGHAYLLKQSLQYMQPDAFAIQAPTDDPQDPDAPPVAA
jgi:hypothetical protein